MDVPHWQDFQQLYLIDCSQYWMPLGDSSMDDENMPSDATGSWVALVTCARTHYLPVGDIWVSLPTQYVATLSRHPAKSGEQRRLSTALGINARTYCSVYFTLDTRRPCILRDRSSGVEYLDTVRAVFWVSCNFCYVAWRLNCSRAASQTNYFSERSMLHDSVHFTTLKSLDYYIMMTFRFNNNKK